MKRLDEAFAADNNDHQCLAFDVKKCKVLDYLSPSVTGHFSSTTLKPHSKVQSAFLGEGISAKEIAELVGVKIYSELEDKPKSFRVWLKPELYDEEAMHDPEPAKERLKEAYEFLRFWKWLVVQDENKQQKITLLNVARDFFLDEELEQYKEWIRRNGITGLQYVFIAGGGALKNIGCRRGQCRQARACTQHKNKCQSTNDKEVRMPHRDLPLHS